MWNSGTVGNTGFPQCGKKFSTVWKTVGLLLASICGAVAAEEAAPSPWIVESDWGPLASWMTDADGAERMRAAGPFWEEAKSPDGKSLRAFPRPFYACATDPASDKTSWDFVWPLASGKTFGEQKSWRIINSFFLDQDRNNDLSQYRFWFLPFWFHGRDEDSTRYAALFPLGGEVRNIFWKDKIQFVLWPFWTRSYVTDVKTTDVLWPIFSRTTSPDHHLEQWRFFPFYSYSKNERQYEKKSVLWPIWTHARYTHPKAQGTAWILFPLFGRVDLNTQQGWMLFPPFVQHIESEKLKRTVVFWPFFVRETGFREKLYLWPFYGYRKDGELERRYWAWPIVVKENNVWGKKKVTRWTVAPFYNNVTQVENPLPSEQKAAEAANVPPGEPRVTGNRTKLWPLFSRRYDLDDQTYRLRLLDLWLGPTPPPVERSWAPLWTVLDYRARGEESDLDVLWGLYRDTRRGEGARAFSLFPLWRHERTAQDGARRWSVLKGLIAYDRTATNRQIRFLWAGRIRLAAPEAKKTEQP